MDSHTSTTLDGGEEFGSAIDTATAVVDGRGSILVWSAGAQRLLGYAAGDVVGRPAGTLLASPLPGRLGGAWPSGEIGTARSRCGTGTAAGWTWSC